MSEFNSYDVILQSGESEQEALDFARGFVFSECEKTINNIGYAQHIDTVNGIEVYYDYGADYYFFTDDDE